MISRKKTKEYIFELDEDNRDTILLVSGDRFRLNDKVYECHRLMPGEWCSKCCFYSDRKLCRLAPRCTDENYFPKLYFRND